MQTTLDSHPKLLGGQAIPNLPWEDRPDGSSAPVWRYSGNPIIGRMPFGRAARVFNSGVVPFEGGFVGVFRADGHDGLPELHVGRSSDAVNWTFEDESIVFRDEGGAVVGMGYAYDPRVVEIEGVYYVQWCNEFHGPTIGLAKTRDFEEFTFIGNAFLPYNRNGVLFPRKVGGHYLMLSRPSDSGHTPFGDIFLSRSPDLKYWGDHSFVMGASKESDWWQNTKIGAGPAPIETEEGWLVFYHGASALCNGLVYSLGAALLDRNDPARPLHRSQGALLAPSETYEAVGHVPNVIFPCAALTDAATGRIAIYYGAADTVTCVAFTQIDLLLEHLKADSCI
jgi:beta-1,4-mannooligosaccharide/beta-1,4-mannosyl-N-acetylglucosamine phosphorylase